MGGNGVVPSAVAVAGVPLVPGALVVGVLVVGVPPVVGVLLAGVTVAAELDAAGLGAGAGSGVAATAATGAGRGGCGGAEAAGSEALIAESAALAGCGWAGAGRGVLLDEVAGKGDRESAYCALARSATSALAMRPRVAASMTAGLLGTVPKEGNGASALGGGGRSWLTRPPSRSCHQLTGVSSPFCEQPVRIRHIAAQHDAARGRPARLCP
jgi:hypothetical protein